MASSSSNVSKKAVGEYAVDHYVQSNMVIGLGTGSTVFYAVERLGEKLKQGALTNITCVPTSEATRAQAEKLSIPLTTLDEEDFLDLVIDGADEVDSMFNLVKGRGAALLREKMVAKCSREFVVVVDDTKIYPEGLGVHGPLPVEVTKFGCRHILRQLTALRSLGSSDVQACLRQQKDSSSLLETDNGNYIVDLTLSRPISDLSQAASDILNVVGVVEHGLFLNMASVVLVGQSDGSVRKLERSK